MRCPHTGLLLALLLVPCAASASPTITYRHLWTDAKGESHFTMCRMTTFDLKTMSAPARPQWQDRLDATPGTVIATVQPPHWDGAWHEDPKPQWIIPLSGTWFMQAMDGTRYEMGPGDIALGEDQGTTGGKGHLAGNVGDGEVKLLVVQLAGAPTRDQPCRFR